MTESTKRRIAKPLGLYIITVFDFIAAGLLPLLAVVSLARSPDAELPFVVVLFSVGLAFTVMAATVWAWIGDNAGRWLLLAAVTVTCLLLISNNLLLISSGESTRNSPIPDLRWIVRGSFCLGMNWWYLNRSEVVGYFKQNKS